MNSFKCPYCSETFPLISTTYQHWQPSFDYPDAPVERPDFNIYQPKPIPPSLINLYFYKCPTCNGISITAKGEGNATQNLDMPLLPNSPAIQFPDYVPDAVKSDYCEAYAIAHLSPKASATLSRRCLQSIIRDFWGIKEKTLYQEISELQNRVSASQWDVLNALRNLGNIGAHPEADVNLIIDIDPDDAVKIIRVIELLIKQWYIERHDQEKLYSEVTSLSDEKCSQKSNPK